MSSNTAIWPRRTRHEVIEGRVLKISGADVFIDVGYKSDGVAPLAQFTDLNGNVTVRPGDVVEVMVDSGHTSEGYVHLSHEKASRLKIWDKLEKALQEQLTISGRVSAASRGPFRQRRRARLHARLSGGCPPRAQRGAVYFPRYSGQNRQTEPQAR